MPSILNLKFKGNKSFVPFSNLNDAESLTKTWKVCTKVASYLEQGQRLENLSWRLWHLQSLMVDSDNAKSKREFKKLSKCMSDKLDKEKGRNITELEAPDFKRSASIDLIQQRAVEKERHREASQNAQPGTITRMQFTFSVDQPSFSLASPDPVNMPDLKPSPEFNKRGRVHTQYSPDDMVTDESGSKDTPSSPPNTTFHFPSLFSNEFGPAALLGSIPTHSNSLNYGEDVSSTHGFSISRPTIELSLDELMTNAADSPNESTSWATYTSPDLPASSASAPAIDQSGYFHSHPYNTVHSKDITMDSVSAPVQRSFVSSASSSNDSDEDSIDSDDEDSEYEAKPPVHRDATPSATSRAAHNRAVVQRRGRGAHSKVSSRSVGRSSTPTGRVPLSIRTTGSNRSSGPSATATSGTSSRVGSTVSHANSGPGGVKAECQNCGATHTPLWRRGLNDELNCNACGLYCKLHKRPRPKTMRNGNGEARAQAAPRQQHHHHHHHAQQQREQRELQREQQQLQLQQQQQQQQQPEIVAEIASKPAPPASSVAQCFNCHTTATPLWRKDDEGKTVCNACGLYYKLHGSARPISMKSDVIRKRSRHDARRAAAIETPSVSPGASQSASPAREASPPTFVPDSSTMSTNLSYDYGFHSTQSELMGALGNDASSFAGQGLFGAHFPGPYHPDLITAYFPTPMDALPFSSAMDSSSEAENGPLSPRLGKRRRMSTDSASEPPSSAVSYSSYNSGYSSASSASHSQRSSIDLTYTGFYGGPPLRATSGPFWHPPMMPQVTTDSPNIFHPPMLPPSEDATMDFLHPPLLPHEEDNLFSTYLHPPMSLPDDSSSHMGGGIHPPMWPTEFDANSVFDNVTRVF